MSCTAKCEMTMPWRSSISAQVRAAQGPTSPSAGGEEKTAILPCLAGRSKVSISRRMWKYQREFKGGPEKRPRAGQGVTSTGSEALEPFSLLQGSTEDSFSFSCHHKPTCDRGQNHIACNYQELVTPSIWMTNYTHI